MLNTIDDNNVMIAASCLKPVFEQDRSLICNDRLLKGVSNDRSRMVRTMDRDSLKGRQAKPERSHVVRLVAFTIALACAHTGVSADLLVPSQDETVLQSYARLVPLVGGSNFRDMGGYATKSGKTVRRGLLFRSGVMTGLTDEDKHYLDQFGFSAIVDLRSSDEIDLYPNHWADQRKMAHHAVDYTMESLIETMMGQDGEFLGMEAFYREMPEMLTSQLTVYFQQILEGRAPIVVNCSAGQDRTGLAAALLLTALGVSRDVILQDYLQSTAFRRVLVERGSVDLEAAAEHNWFARMMLAYGDHGGARAEPLMTPEGRPFLKYALEYIENAYGSVDAYLEAQLGVDGAARRQLKSMYLE
ncbi:MAG: tyrosine-protein phosphatase [Gammaproteobacteria bacterium]|nr:MAG: tyrosine-protein phosphatase [Gammaproteobacteria bacterium]